MSENKKSSFGIIKMFCCAVAFILLIITAYHTVGSYRNAARITSATKYRNMPYEPSLPASETHSGDVQYKLSSEEKGRLIAVIDDALIKAETANNLIIDEFRKKYKNSVDQSFNLANKNITFVVSNLSSFNFCAKYTYATCKDFLRGSSEAQNMIKPIIESNIYSYCRQGESKGQEMLTDICHDLADNTNVLRKELGQCTQDITSSLLITENNYPLEEFYGDMAKVSADIDNMCNKSIVPVITEVIIAKSTYSIMKNSFLGIAEKIAASIGTAGTMAVADGPIPVGDIVGTVVGIGGTLWSCADFIEARKTLPDTLKNELDNSVKNYRLNVFDSTYKQAESWVQIFNDRNAQLANELKKQVEGDLQ